jgi:Putative zinc-finger
MSHVDDGTLHALVDNALDAQERSAVEAHLASCGDCARRFAEATAMARQVVSLLDALDDDAGAIRIVRPPVIASASTPAVVPSPVASPVAPSARVVADQTVIPIASRMRVLRRVAVAASVLVVAGVSYQVGRTRDVASMAERAPSVALAAPAAKRRAPLPVALATADSVATAPEAVVVQRASGGPRSEAEQSGADRSDVASGAAAAPVTVSAKAAAPAAKPAPAAPAAFSTPLPSVAVAESVRDTAGERREEADARSREAESALSRVQSQERARAQASPPSPSPSQGQTRIRRGPTDQLSQVVVTGAASAARQPAAASSTNAVADNAAPAKVVAAPKPVLIAGYTAQEDESLPSLTRRRYVSPNGTSIVLLIMKPPTEQKAAPPQDPESAFVVFSTNGQSTVRWRAHGRHYELQGALGPDSLVKIATLFK